MSIEKQVADVILQRSQTISLHGVKFNVPQPTIATLIRISELVAELPEPEDQEDKNPLAILKDLKNCQVVGEIMATLIVGEKRRKWYDLGYRRRFKRLSHWVVDNCSPNDLCACLGELLKVMQLADFFVFSASLRGMKLIRVAETTIQSGQ